jgi:hypothetical protein
VVVWGVINPGDRVLAKRQGRPVNNMITQKGTWFISEVLVQFTKVLGKRIKMKLVWIPEDVGRNKAEIDSGRRVG